MKAADKALNALENVKKGMQGRQDKKKCLKSELARAFPCKIPKTTSWKHRFVCLAKHNQTKFQQLMPKKMVYWKLVLVKSASNSNQSISMERNSEIYFMKFFPSHVMEEGFSSAIVFPTLACLSL